MLREFSQRLDAAQHAIAATARATGEHHMVSLDALPQIEGSVLNALEMGGHIFFTAAGVVLSKGTRELCCSGIDMLHLNGTLAALAEFARSAGRKIGDTVAIEQIKCFAPEIVNVQRGLELLEMEYSIRNGKYSIRLTRQLWYEMYPVAQ